jgi:RNA-binding protein
MSDAPSQLRGSDRKYLRGLAHGLDPVVRIGSSGLTRSVLRAIGDALERHELVKIKIPADREERKVIAAEASRATRSELAGQVGQVAILYRRARDEERRKITLPSARS